MAAQRPGRLLCVLAAAVVVLLAAAACSRGVPPARVVLKGSDSYSARPKAPAKPAGTPARAPGAQPGRTGPSAVGVVEVRKDDTLYAVSRRHRIALRDLIEVNRLAPPYLLRVGQRLRLPPPREHVVVPGDTVYGVSRRYGVDMTALVRLNRIGPPYTITVGQRLRLPAATALLARPAPVRTAQPQAAKPGPGPTAKPPAPVPKPDSAAAQSPRRAPVAMPPRKPGARPAAVPAPPPRSAGTFHWPLRGRILSPFGPKGNG
ncbi:MAG: LysM domain-containing protein, partial [Alphaproteobacteria bacterium]